MSKIRIRKKRSAFGRRGERARVARAMKRASKMSDDDFYNSDETATDYMDARGKVHKKASRMPDDDFYNSDETATDYMDARGKVHKKRETGGGSGQVRSYRRRTKTGKMITVRGYTQIRRKRSL